MRAVCLKPHHMHAHPISLAMPDTGKILLDHELHELKKR
jgi:hypothetical protein